MTPSTHPGRQTSIARPLLDQFEPRGDHIWLDNAHQGVLPRRAAAAARRAIRWKRAPHEMTAARFASVPADLRMTLGRLLDVPPDQIILGNSNAHGIHLIANGFPWKRRDEVLLVRGDFPSSTLPWLGLGKRGVRVRFIEPGGTAVTADEVLANLSRRTRLFCTTWAHSFTGALVDVASIGEACHANGVRFVLNASQAVGARPLRPLDLPVDAVTSVGFKWLCGPYGTGFAWVRPDLLASLNVNRLYWLAFMSAEDLVGDRPPDLSRDIGACRYDIFGTANFFNFTAWRVAIDLVLAVGLETIALRNEALVQRFLAGLPGDRFEILASSDADRRSSLICFSHRDPSRNSFVFDRLRSAGIDTAARRGLLRVSPHFYNTADEIDLALGVLHSMA